MAVVITAHSAAANQLPDSATFFSEDATVLPAADLSGWFSNGDSGFLFPVASDPSQIWTSAESLATLSAWQNLIAGANGDPALLAGLSGLGMNNSSGGQLFNISLSLTGSGASNGSALQSVSISQAPEPALLGIWGTGMALLGLIAALHFTRILVPGGKC